MINDSAPDDPCVPYRLCNACGGTGKRGEGGKCEVCAGKGAWNAMDIQRYHEKYPHVCKQSCGEKHIAPSFRSNREVEASLDNMLQELRNIAAKAKSKQVVSKPLSQLPL